MPPNVDVWAVLGSGNVFFDTPALFYKNLPKDAVVHVYRPSEPTCQKAQPSTTPKASVTSGAASAPKAVLSAKPSPSAVDVAAARRKKEAEERESKEREVRKAHAQKESEAAKQARERREKQAQADEEERHRQRENERTKVLPRQGVTSTWRTQVLPAQKTKGVTAAWPTRELPSATTAGCGASRTAASRLPDTKDAAAIMRARGPLLHELTAFQKAKGSAEKEATRAKLRELFESLRASAAEPFQVMLGTKDALAVMFRDVLTIDAPFREELLSILKKKYWVPCDPPLSERPLLQQTTAPRLASVPQAPDAARDLTLPVVSLTDEAAFNRFHKQLELQIAAMGASCDQIVTPQMQGAKAKLLEHVKLLKAMLSRAEELKVAAFKKTDAADRAEALRAAGAAYTTPLVLSAFWSLYINIGIATDTANAAGVSPLPAYMIFEGSSPLDKPIRAFEVDKDLLVLTQAAIIADVEGMKKALPAAQKAYDRHVESVNAWIVSIGRGAEYSKKAIQVANIVMIAISLHEALRDAIQSGSAPSPPTIVGFLPGGIALGSRVSAVTLAELMEAIRRLVAIGALDGTLIGSVGLIGGGPDISIPELQRPTSLSVGKPNQPGGDTANAKPTTGGRPAPKPENYRGRFNAARRAAGKKPLPDDWDAHHRIPQKYRDHPEFKDFDFDNPSNIKGIQGRPARSNIHKQITNLWEEFGRTHGNATRKQIEAFERFIDSKFHAYWWK